MLRLIALVVVGCLALTACKKAHRRFSVRPRAASGASAARRHCHASLADTFCGQVTPEMMAFAWRRSFRRSGRWSRSLASSRVELSSRSRMN